MPQYWSKGGTHLLDDGFSVDPHIERPLAGPKHLPVNRRDKMEWLLQMFRLGKLGNLTISVNIVGMFGPLRHRYIEIGSI